MAEGGTDSVRGLSSNQQPASKGRSIDKEELEYVRLLNFT